MNLLRFSISPLPVSAGWYALPLRLIIGFGFVQHGYAKLQRGPEDFINVLHAMGLPVPFILGWATIVVELVGGLMILAGALIPLATVPWPLFFLLRFLLSTCRTGLALSSCNRSTLPALTSVNQAMKRTCSILPASSPCASEDLGRSRSMAC
jgi:uncharacterized membrane protein YphA (DoxX/SURF4 family)